MMVEPVTIYEVGPRDGLQNEKQIIATADKIRLVDELSACGFNKIEVTSFVSPKWVPQLADAAQVMATITRDENISYAVLAPNMRGLTDALAAQAQEIAIFASASEGFSRKNINCSITESLARFAPIAATVKEHGIPLRGYLSCVIACPYDGPTPPANVAKTAKALLDLGCYEISLGDTIGAGTPDTITAMLDAVLSLIPASCLAGHFHDNHGQALENITVALDKGLRVFDASVGGLGGCPYAPGAAGNVASEAVVDMLESMNFTTGIDVAKLHQVAKWARTLRSST